LLLQNGDAKDVYVGDLNINDQNVKDILNRIPKDHKRLGGDDAGIVGVRGAREDASEEEGDHHASVSAAGLGFGGNSSGFRGGLGGHVAELELLLLDDGGQRVEGKGSEFLAGLLPNTE